MKKKPHKETSLSEGNGQCCNVWECSWKMNTISQYICGIPLSLSLFSAWVPALLISAYIHYFYVVLFPPPKFCLIHCKFKLMHFIKSLHKYSNISAFLFRRNVYKLNTIYPDKFVSMFGDRQNMAY